MPSPLLQLRIPQDLADWLEAKYPSRGEVAEYVRQLLTAEQMKEAVAPLVPQFSIEGEPLNEYELATDHATQFAGRGGREPKPKARRKKVTVGDLESDEPIDLMTALKASVEAMKSVEVPDQPVSVMNRGGPALTTQEPSLLPARCNRGACTGTINPVSGRCLRCNQTPLKESK